MIKVYIIQPIHILKLLKPQLWWRMKQSFFWPNIIFRMIQYPCNQLLRILRIFQVKYLNLLDQWNWMGGRLHALKDTWTQRLRRSTKFCQKNICRVKINSVLSAIGTVEKYEGSTCRIRIRWCVLLVIKTLHYTGYPA